MYLSERAHVAEEYVHAHMRERERERERERMGASRWHDITLHRVVNAYTEIADTSGEYEKLTPISDVYVNDCTVLAGSIWDSLLAR